MKIQVTAQGSKFSFKPAEFLGAEFGAYREATRSARFDAATKSQVAATKSAACTALAALAKAGFTFTPESKGAIDAIMGAVEEVKADVAAADVRADEMDALLAKRGMGLFSYQRAGVRWLAGRTGALLADDMGLGKTVQVLAALPADAAVLVVAPAVAKGVWKAEAAKWRPDFSVSVLAGRGSFRWPGEGEIVVTNYDVLSDECGEAPAGVVVVADEAHAVKSYKAKRSKRFGSVSKAARAAGGRVWLLTATPMLNRPSELYSVLGAADLVGESFGGWTGFCKAFGATRGQYGIEWGDPSPTAPEKLAAVCLRRMKTEVLKDLPSKRVATIQVESSFSAADTKRLTAIAEALASVQNIADAQTALGRAGITFEEISSARAVLAEAKTDALLSLVESYEEAGEPLVVFSAHRAPIAAVAARPGWASITGDTPPEERSRIEADFQAGKLLGVAATIKAGGVAITLTRASNAVFVDEEWTPALNSQAQDRIYRIGQDRAVLIQRLVSAHPLDRRVSELLAEKSDLIGASVDAARRTDEPPSSVPDLSAVVIETAPEPVADSAPAPLPTECPF